MKIFPVILAGGLGTRLWPLSKPERPKQLQALVTERTMLQETLLRINNWPELQPPIIILNENHCSEISQQCIEIGITPSLLILEPFGRNTAAAIACATHYLVNTHPDSLVLVLSADHTIEDTFAFHTAVKTAISAAKLELIVTFGIKPLTPQTGYGYIQRGHPIFACPNVYKVARYAEKPELELAKEYLASGDHFWSSGMFLFSSQIYLKELGHYAAEIKALSQLAYEKGVKNDQQIILDAEYFSQCPSLSIDYAIMEYTALAAIVPVEMGWNDVGSWSSIWEVSKHDETGNLIKGDVYIKDVKNCLIRADSRFVAALGVSNLIVVETANEVLISEKSCDQNVKHIVDYLKIKPQNSSEDSTQPLDWGSVSTTELSNNIELKQFVLRPKFRLPEQLNLQANLHWLVTGGTAVIHFKTNTRP